MEQERRRHPRYCQKGIELAVARPGIKGILSVKPTVECLDFSLTGLNFASDQAFQANETVIIDLCVFGLRADELRASGRTAYEVMLVQPVERLSIFEILQVAVV